MNVVHWLVSIPAVQAVLGSALTICFSLASRDYTFDGSAFYLLFYKVSGLGLGFMFRV